MFTVAVPEETSHILERSLQGWWDGGSDVEVGKPLE